MKRQLALNINKREKGDEYFLKITKEYDNLILNGPNIPDYVRKTFSNSYSIENEEYNLELSLSGNNNIYSDEEEEDEINKN